MSLKQWLNNGWLRIHKTNKNEIENLLMIVDRDLKDAKAESSRIWFLTLCPMRYALCFYQRLEYELNK